MFCVEDVMEESFSQAPECPPSKLALKSPLHLGKVCRAWREIAWATPQLWKTMSLSVPNIPQMSMVDLVRQWLSRSGQQPLSISLMFPNFPEELKGIHESTSSLLDAIRDHSYHWRRMQLFIPETYLDILLWNVRLPLLETLKIHPIFQPMHILHIHLVNAPLLTRVEVDDMHFQHLSLEWTNITFVGFTCILLEEYFPLLRLAPALTGCKFIMMVKGDDDYDCPTEIFTHQSLRTMHIRPQGRPFFPDLDPFFSKVSFPSLVDFTYDSSLSDEFPLDSLLSLFDRSQCSITHFALVIHEDGAPMDEQDLVLLLKALPSVTHLSLLNSDRDILLLTNHFLRHFAESLQGKADEFLPHLQVLKYEGWRSFDWEEVANMCHSRSIPRFPASDNDASKRIPKFAILRCLEFELARDLGTTIHVQCNVYEDDVDMVDFLQFA